MSDSFLRLRLRVFSTLGVRQKKQKKAYNFLIRVWQTALILRISFLMVERRLGWIFSKVSALTYEGDIMVD